MKLGKTLYVTQRIHWRSWLAENHHKEKEVWLIYYRKSSGKPRISYNEAVEEALCYGWIDSTMKGIDEEKFAQRFTPRRKGSPISEMNKERVRRLMKSKLMTPKGLQAISFNHKEKFVIASDILQALKANPQAWTYFQKFSLGYKRVRIGYIESRRDNKEMFKNSLNNFIKKTAKNQKFGMVQ
ncbi:MAG: YdeI/OmpD-associated family protein [Candidatus Woesearchaeota archaeon]|jgi:uncharacterized protein YdeI (YjbR/CyaY-like superfamily)